MNLPIAELDALDGLMDREEIEPLAHLAAQVPEDQAIVELGSYKGRSACWLAAGSRAGHGAHVYCVDLWDQGNWTAEYLRQGVARGRILEVGYSKLDPIFQGKVRRQPGSNPRILWAPTHTGIQAVSSYPACIEVTRRFPADWDVTIAAHPAQTPGHQVTMQALVDADVVIADAGSTLYEAWAIGRPVVFPDWLVKAGVLARTSGSFEARIYQDRIGYHAGSPAELLRMVETALARGMDAREQEFMDSIFPPALRGRSGEVAARALAELAGA